MRDPKRIKPILKLIEEIWIKNPDLRLTQIIMSALEINQDPFYIEDEFLFNKLKNLKERFDSMEGK